LANQVPTSLGARLAAAGVGLAAGAVIGYAVASRPVGAPGSDAAIPQGTDAARRAIAERVRAPASVENLEQLAHLLAQLGPEAIPAIAPTILHPGETLDAPRALVLLQFWIDRDPKSAAEWTSKRSPLGYRMLALAPAVERIAETDPKLAVKFVGRGVAANPNLLKPLVRGWVHSGQPGVEDWIRNLGYGFKRQKALGAFARAKIEKEGAAAAIAWLAALPESEDGLREDAFLRLTSELTYADPAAGVAWYEEHRDGPNGKGLMMAVVDAWVAVDGPGAMRWASQQPAGKERDDAVLDGVRWWGVADIDGLKRWGREMGVEPLAGWFQPGLPIFAKLYGNEEPIEGIHWAERIADPPTRDLTLVQIAREWHASDPTAAEAWIAQSPLSEEDRERARKLNVPRGPQPNPDAPPVPAPPAP
jgi:hypothetical protein